MILCPRGQHHRLTPVSRSLVFLLSFSMGKITNLNLLDIFILFISGEVAFSNHPCISAYHNTLYTY